MPDLNFEILASDIKPFAAVPTLVFKLQITNGAPGEQVYAAALKCQVLIEATKRQYDAGTQENLTEVFGAPERWEETVKSLYWTTITIPVPTFEESTVIEVLIGCCEDHLAAAGKYFYSVTEGDVPLAFLFSGTLFYTNATGNMQIMQVPWHKEALYRMPAALWHAMMETYFPDHKWLQVRKDLFDRLYKYKSQRSFPTMESCIESLLDNAFDKTQQAINEQR